MSLCKIDSNENENNILVAINSNISLSTILEIYNEEESRKILDSQKPMKSYFQNCYNDQSARFVSNFRFLERYFRNIEEKNPEICRSVIELFKDANDYPRIILSLKKKHNEIIGLMGRIKLKIVSNFDDFDRALVNNNQRSLQIAMQLINVKEEIEECYGLLKQLKENCEDLEPKTNDSLDFRVFGSASQVQYSYAIESRQRHYEKERLKDELNSIVASKYAADVNCEILNEKIDKADLSLKTLNQLKERLERDKDNLEKSINENDSAKEKLVKEISDPTRHIELMRNCEERRKELDNNFLKRMNQVRAKQVDILQDVEETRVLNKLYHLIFILDESGSMLASFDLVRNCVYDIVKRRNEKTKSDEKISIIKFNTKAEIEVLDASVRDKIEISDLRGGGTSFLKPLEKLEEILQSINSDIYIPVVFFLSDGYAESKSTVSSFCQEIYSRKSNFSFLFLSVGFGDAPDSETLKEMSKIFNSGCEVLKIGNEMIKLYYQANNHEQLMKVFTLYEKLFDHQKGLIQQKTEYLNNLIIEVEKNRQIDSDILENMFERNQNSLNNRLKESTKHANEIESNLKNLNEVYKEKISEIQGRINETEDSINKLGKNMKEYKKELSEIKPKCDEYEVSYIEFKEQYEKSNEKYKEALKKEMDGFDEVHRNAENFRNENLGEQMKLFKELGIAFKDQEEEASFKKNYSDLQAHYFDYMKSKHDINAAASNIEVELKNVVYYLGLINKKLECCESLCTPDSLIGIIWDLVKFYLSNKFEIAYKNNDIDFLYRVISIEINSKNKKSNSSDDDEDADDDDDNPSKRYKKAFNLVFKDLAPSSTFTELERNESFVSSFLDFYTSKIDDIKGSIREANQSIKKIEKNENNEKKQQEGIAKLEDEIKKLEQEIDEYKNYKSEVRKITYVINNFRLQAKERFLKEVMAKKVKSVFSNVKTQLIPQIEVLKDSKTVRSIRN